LAVVTTSDKVRFYESIFGSGKLDSPCRNFYVCCPMCDPKDRSKKKLAILVENDGNHCWVCGWKGKNLAPLVAKYGSKEQLADYKQRFMSDEARRRFEKRRGEDDGAQKEPEKLKLPPDFRLLVHANRNDHDVKSLLRYLSARGITERDLWYYRIGCSDERRWSRRAIVPSYDAAGELNYFTGRAIDAQRFRYDGPSIDKAAIVFNEINVDWTKPLIVCEGPFDLMKCGENAVPLLGSTLSPLSSLFCNIVMHRTPVTLAFDSDMKKRAWRCARFLSSYDLEVSIVEVEDDPGAMEKEEFAEAVTKAIPYDHKTDFNVKLEALRSMSFRL
jgi:hypothetical protein